LRAEARAEKVSTIFSEKSSSLIVKAAQRKKSFHLLGAFLFLAGIERAEARQAVSAQSSVDGCERASIQRCPGQGVPSSRDDAKFPLPAQKSKNSPLRRVF